MHRVIHVGLLVAPLALGGANHAVFDSCLVVELELQGRVPELESAVGCDCHALFIFFQKHRVEIVCGLVHTWAILITGDVKWSLDGAH